MSECKWSNTLCLNAEEKCHICSSRDYYYVPDKRYKPKNFSSAAKKNKRRGSEYEYDNHIKNQDLFQGVTSRMTPNSGAGQIKGDEEISGIISILEELKQQDKKLSRGSKSFSVQKQWLDKLKSEALDAHKEFWYLKFSFGQETKETYVILEDDMVMSLVSTIIEDRKTAKKAERKIDIANKEKRLIELENLKLQAEIDLLKARLTEDKEQAGG